METVQPQKKRGPKPTGKGVPIQVRVQPDQLAKIDAWAARQGVTRPKAIKAMIDALDRLGGLD
jgi:Ribbon-helix-helix protein, copG family.